MANNTRRLLLINLYLLVTNFLFIVFLFFVTNVGILNLTFEYIKPQSNAYFLSLCKTLIFSIPLLGIFLGGVIAIFLNSESLKSRLFQGYLLAIIIGYGGILIIRTYTLFKMIIPGITQN